MKYVALLRGINVGGNNKVEMAKLKKCFEDLGYRNVSTYINSGNVLFETTEDSAPPFEVIERKLKKTFGFPIRTIVRSHANIQKLCKALPSSWMNDDEQRTDILFLWDEFDNRKTLSLIKTTPKVDTLKYAQGAIIWNLKRTNYTKSSMHKFIGTLVYKHMTARNINTVRKLAELMDAKKKGA